MTSKMSLMKMRASARMGSLRHEQQHHHEQNQSLDDLHSPWTCDDVDHREH